MSRIGRVLRGDLRRRSMSFLIGSLVLCVVVPVLLATPLGEALPDDLRHTALIAAAVAAAATLRIVAAMGWRLLQVQEALDATQAAIAVYDARDRLVIVNQRYREVLDLPHDKFAPGVTYAAIVRPSLELTLSGAELERELAYRVAIQHAADGRPTDRIYPGHRWVRVTKSRTATGLVVGIALDVTEYYELKEALEKEVRRFEALAAGAPVGICQVSGAGTIQFLNGALVSMLGASTADDLAASTGSFSSPQWTASGFADLIARLRESGAESEIRLHVDGEERNLLIRKAFVSSGALEEKVLPPDRAYGENIFIFVDITERQRAEARIRYLAHHDVLTGALNRLAFADDLADAARTARPDCPASLIAIDLDRFKPVNDVYGHAAGDELLRQIVQRLSSVLGPGSTLYRMGGDEFAILSRPGADVRAGELAVTLVALACEPYQVGGHAVIVGASAGISTLPGDTDTPESLIHYADLALYQAKRSGGGEARTFDSRVLSTVDDRRRLELELVDALENDGLSLVYQPVFTLDRRRVVGAEVLARWPRDHDGELVPPSVFIPIAENADLIGRLDRQILAKTLAETASFVRRGNDPRLVFVNMSVRTFTDRGIIGCVASALQTAQVPGCHVVIELTESFAVRNADIVSQTMREIAETGVRFAIDDFGTGYTSLRLVASLPISFIKLDKSFIRDLGRQDRPNAHHVVRGIVDLTHTMGVDVIAEGVETEAEFATIAGMSCDYVQGDLLAPPVPRAELEFLLGSLGERARLHS